MTIPFLQPFWSVAHLSELQKNKHTHIYIYIPPMGKGNSFFQMLFEFWMGDVSPIEGRSLDHKSQLPFFSKSYRPQIHNMVYLPKFGDVFL